ncbi:hypothetical protein [Klebsiella pneumoniae IS46]|nr:hypothetical protein [Klebsiella pneumoniae IS46]
MGKARKTPPVTIRLVCLSRVLRSVTSPGDKMPSAVIYFNSAAGMRRKPA